MNAWDFIAPMFTALGVGQILQFLQALSGEKELNRKIFLKASLYALLLIVMISGGSRFLNLQSDQRNIFISIVWLVIFALLFWRTRSLLAAKKAENP